MLIYHFPVLFIDSSSTPRITVCLRSAAIHEVSKTPQSHRSHRYVEPRMSDFHPPIFRAINILFSPFSDCEMCALCFCADRRRCRRKNRSNTQPDFSLLPGTSLKLPRAGMTTYSGCWLRPCDYCHLVFGYYTGYMNIHEIVEKTFKQKDVSAYGSC